ncbi:hypothetical protein EPR50_G00126700 [Scomber scombrus]|uniref:Uncharacterized protein n=1 Tax=Scomber scombrus TaxID=13677 RepID=A0AAV1PTM6_SCOSC
MSSSLLLSQHRAPNPTHRPAFISDIHIDNVGLLQYCSDEKSRTAAPLRGEHKQSQGLPGSCRPSTVLHAERPARPSAHRCVLKHQPFQAAEGLLLLVKPLHSLAFILMLQGKVDLNTAPHAKPLYCHGISLSVEHIGIMSGR